MPHSSPSYAASLFVHSVFCVFPDSYQNDYMKKEQRIVAMGSLSGVISMVFTVWILCLVLPDTAVGAFAIDRIVFALRANAFAVLPLLIGIIVVGNGRFLSDAINPLAHKESETMEINGRVVDNTFQQTFIFFVGTLALSTILTSTSLKVIAALAITFVLARIAFWVGYRINPLYRAFGMGATGYMNVGILATVIYHLVF